jgi:hypothetical protein
MVDGTSIVAFQYTTYEIPRQHLCISIFAHEFFEDKIRGFTDGTAGSINARARGRMAVSIDWMDIKLWVAAMNSAKREFKGAAMANVDSRLTNVIRLNPKMIELRSKTMGVEFGDFSRHTIFENFSDACPILTARNCVPKS